MDDEYLVRKRLLATIDWSSLGICEVYEAEDGKQALGISIEKEPDIIVTDINMPEISGTELMVALNESALYPRVILISGYDEFEFARSGLKLGAVDYLLKPVDEKELINIVKNCIENFENSKNQKELLNSLESSSSEIQKRIVSDLLLGRIENPNNSLLRLKNVSINFDYSSVICLIAHYSAMVQTEKNDYLEETLIRFIISNVMEDILPLYFEHFLIVEIDDLNVTVLFSNQKEKELKDLIKNVIATTKEKLREFFQINIAFGIGVEVADIFDLSKSYKTAKYAININTYNDWSGIVNYGKNDKTDWLDLQYVYSEYNLMTISTDIKNGNRASSSENLKILTEEFLNQHSGHPTPLQVKLFYINVLNTLFKNCLISGPPSEEFLNICLDSIEETDAFFTSERLVKNLQKIVDFLISQYSTFMENKRHWLIDRITEYINENYASPLTMKNVASKFYLNPSYFCKLFKEEIGVTFTHYLMKLRVEKSKELMLDSSQKLYTIASSVGYSNAQYFSTIFKEIEGITPSQYRNVH